MLLTVKQFSQQHNIPLDRCYAHIEQKLLPVIKIGSVYLIDSDDFTKYQKNLEKVKQAKKDRTKNATKARLKKFREKRKKILT